MWTNSYQWAKESKEIKILDDKFYIPSDDFNKITDSEFKRYRSGKFTTFDHFVKSFNIWCVDRDNCQDWKQAKCTCPSFLKEYICKHVVGLAIRLKEVSPPLIAKSVPIGQKRKRGRPTLAKKAFIRE